MQNLPSDFLFLVLFSFALLLGRKQVSAFIKDLTSVGEDCWTWTTQAGEIFEDAEVDKIENDHLVLKHRFGVVHLSVEELSEKSRHLLLTTPQWRSHLSSAPSNEGIAAFVPEQIHATQSA
jgi:hypothetical protein